MNDKLVLQFFFFFYYVSNADTICISNNKQIQFDFLMCVMQSVTLATQSTAGLQLMSTVDQTDFTETKLCLLEQVTAL